MSKFVWIEHPFQDASGGNSAILDAMVTEWLETKESEGYEFVSFFGNRKWLFRKVDSEENPSSSP